MCYCTSRPSHHPTELAIWDRQRLRGLTDCKKPGRAGGKPCHLVRLDMATLPTKRFHPLPATVCSISPELLLKDGLLHENACEDSSFPSGVVDYGAVIQFKHRLLDQVWDNFSAGIRRDLRAPYERFCHLQAHWLEDYALFRALKEKYQGISYLDWPAELVQRVPAAITNARRELSKLIDKVRFAQFLIFRQAQQLKEYAHSRGVGLIGDLPFFVSPDSSDVWAHPELFLLDEGFRPRFVAGVPPDYFSENGQLWGNPVYDWGALRRTGFLFFIDRLRALLAHVDVIRLDHFRAFVAAWHVPCQCTDGTDRGVDAGPRCRVFSCGPKGTRRAAIYR